MVDVGKGKGMPTKGFFISLEGIDGSGKTTLQENLLFQLSRKYKVISIREPGGTVISEKIRDMLLDVRNHGIMGRTEALLYAAARSQVVEEIIRPALAEGKVIVADRYMDSTIAYQGYGRGLELGFLADLNRICTGGLYPDLTLLLDIEPELAYKRCQQQIPDRLEQEGTDFQARVRAGYIELWKKEPGRIKCLQATQPPHELAEQAMEMITKRIF